MKKLLFPAIVLLAIQLQSCQQNASSDKSDAAQDTTTKIDDHTSQTAVDWAGTYEGTVPCADCSGIKTTIKLYQDETFSYTAEYLEKNTTVQDTGKLMWHGGTVVHLMGKDVNTEYKVGENQIIQLDTEGKVIEGPTAEKYYLVKTK